MLGTAGRLARHIYIRNYGATILGSSAYLVQGRRSLGCPVCFYGR